MLSEALDETNRFTRVMGPTVGTGSYIKASIGAVQGRVDFYCVTVLFLKLSFCGTFRPVFAHWAFSESTMV